MSEQVTISFYAPAELRAKLDNWAVQDHRSRSSLLCHILEPLIEAREREVAVVPAEQLQKTLSQSIEIPHMGMEA
jgi:hypothetical protein